MIGLCVGEAASAQQLIEHESDFIETYLTAARISASRVIVGVSPPSEFAPVRPSALVLVPDQMAGKAVCARWLSIDALYSAQATYKFPETWTAEVAQLAYIPQHEARVRDLRPAELGLTVTLGSCEEDEQVYLPALWNAEVPDLVELEITINSGGTDEAWIAAGDAYFDCSPIEGRTTQAADFRCRIPIAQLQADAEIELVRIRRGQPLDPVPFEVKLAAGK